MNLNFPLCGIFLGLTLSLGGSKPLQGSDKSIKEHKKKVIEEIISNPSKKKASYPLARVLLTIKADDADNIPKAEHAGEIVVENGLSLQLMHNGMKMLKDCYYGSWMTDIIYALRGHHEPQEEKVFYEVLPYIPHDAVMIELGAYWAYYSLWFSHAIVGAKNYVVEPDLNNLNIGKKNFSINGKEARFYQAYVPMSKGEEGGFGGIQKLSIDSFLQKEGIAHVHILHSDIQGSEYEMLQSSLASIKANKIDYFFISTHSSGLHQSCMKFLKTYGFQIIAEHTMEESCSVDGLIVAKRKNVAGPERVTIRKYKQ